jgi:hypothetical protein
MKNVASFVTLCHTAVAAFTVPLKSIATVAELINAAGVSQRQQGRVVSIAQAGGTKNKTLFNYYTTLAK